MTIPYPSPGAVDGCRIVLLLFTAHCIARPALTRPSARCGIGIDVGIDAGDLDVGHLERIGRDLGLVRVRDRVRDRVRARVRARDWAPARARDSARVRARVTWSSSSCGRVARARGLRGFSASACIRARVGLGLGSGSGSGSRLGLGFSASAGITVRVRAREFGLGV